MKRIILLILLLSLITIIFITYRIFFLDKINTEQTKIDYLKDNLKLSDKKDNLIKNLKYKVSVDVNNNDEYLITAKLSETRNDSGIEFVDMQEVEATYKKKKSIIKVNSDSALFNSSNYNTNFFGNIIIKYFTYKINSDEMTIDFDNNVILISKNVNIYNEETIIKADNLKIYLDKKEIEIYMDKEEKNIKINHK